MTWSLLRVCLGSCYKTCKSYQKLHKTEFCTSMCIPSSMISSCHPFPRYICTSAPIFGELWVCIKQAFSFPQKSGVSKTVLCRRLRIWAAQVAPNAKKGKAKLEPPFPAWPGLVCTGDSVVLLHPYAVKAILMSRRLRAWHAGVRCD